jgi:hypothetical protein
MATALKNKRLSQYDREVIGKFALQQIEKTEPSGDLDATYNVAADAIAAAVEAKFPAKDMKVLAKYDMAKPDACIYVSSGGFGAYDQFCFRDGDKRIPTRPNRYCRNQPLLLEGEAETAYDAYTAAKKARDAAVAVRRKDFATLIANTTTFNALADIWPAVEALRTQIVGSGAALSVMSDEVVSRIKADPALALAA